MKRNLADIELALNNAKKRLREVQEHGNAAISENDIRNGYDADFYLIRCPLLANHVKYYEQELEAYKENNPQLSLLF